MRSVVNCTGNDDLDSFLPFVVTLPRRILDSAHGNLSHTAAATSGMKAICRCTGNNNLESISCPVLWKLSKPSPTLTVPWRNWQSASCAEYGVARLCCGAFRVLLWSQRLRDEVKQTWCLIVDNMFKFVEVRAATVT